MITKKEKLNYIRSIDIEVDDNIESVDEVVRFAKIKEILKEGHGDTYNCFGTVDFNNPACCECFLCGSGDCEKYAEYLNKVKENKLIMNEEKIEVNESEELEQMLSKLNFRSKETVSYKIGRIILTSKDRDYDEVLKEIEKVMGGGANRKQAEVRFHQAKKLILDRLKLNVEIEVVKTMRITNGS